MVIITVTVGLAAVKLLSVGVSGATLTSAVLANQTVAVSYLWPRGATSLLAALNQDNPTFFLQIACFMVFVINCLANCLLQLATCVLLFASCQFLLWLKCRL
jgi:hypothetical protein